MFEIQIMADNEHVGVMSRNSWKRGSFKHQVASHCALLVDPKAGV